MSPLVAALAAGALALAGQRLGWLTGGGALAAAAVGTAVFLGGGLAGASLLALFFVSGSLLTRRSTGASPARTARQVVANGAWAALGAALVPVSGAGWAVLAGALSAAQADTWATEIGAAAATPTRLLTTGAVVPAGTSGGVTPRGTGGGVAGAVAMGGLAGITGVPVAAAVLAIGGGVLGFVLDSLLGATVQSTYHCDSCNTGTETRVHRCGRNTRHLRGWKWLDNDGVNFLSTGAGALVAFGGWFWL